MALTQSTQARHHGSQDFEGYYTQLCALQDTCPLPSVKAHLSEGALDLNADRIRLPDWTPILNTLRINKSLDFVGVRSYFQQNGQDVGKKFKTSRRPPPIRSKEQSYRLCQALSGSLSVSHALTFIELQGIPLRLKDVQILTKGIMKNASLEHLSLEGCRVGDHGLHVLTGGLKHIPTITSMNFSACGVTTNGAEHLAKLVKHQSTNRHSEAWKDSLRYRRPDLDRMAGIRRITLNANPLISDDGALAFAETLRDDLWLKALDLQQCGISNIGAKAFLDSLHENSTIVVLDIRKNPLVDQDLLKAVMEQVMINGGGQQTQYKWLHTSPPKQRSKSKRSKTKSHSNGIISKKTNKHGNGGPAKSSSRRSRSPGGVLVKVVPQSYKPRVAKPGPGFVPWRTAARATQRSMAVPMELVVQVDSSSSPSGSTTPTRSGGTSIHVHAVSSTPSSEQDTSHKDTSAATTMMSSMRAFDADDEIAKRRIKDMKVENEELRRRLYIESRARAASDARVVELEVDNSRLKHQVQLLEARSPGSPLRRQPVGDNGLSELDDESVLDSIEESFQKFHGFLDLLRDAGLGQLCNLVGLSPEAMKSPTVASILQNHQPYEQTRPSYEQTRPSYEQTRPSTSTVASTNYGMEHAHYTVNQQSTFQPSNVPVSRTQGHGTNPYVPSSMPGSYGSGAVKPNERTMVYNGAKQSVAETYGARQRVPETGHAMQDLHANGRDSYGVNNVHHDFTRNATHQEPSVIHSKPLFSPPEPSDTVHVQSSNNSNLPLGLGGTILSEVQASVAINTPASIESSALYQASSAIRTQSHPPHASLLPTSLTQVVAPVPQASLSQGVTSPSTEPPRTEDLSIERVIDNKLTGDLTIHSDMQSGIPQQKIPQDDNDNLKDILFSKPKDISQGDSTSVIVGSVLSFTNPERSQIAKGAGDAKQWTKSQDGNNEEQKDVSKGSASEDDYEDDFLPSSDTGSNLTPRNASDRTSTPSKSSLSHRTYTRSYESGSDHSDIDDIKSLGSSIREDIGETPSPNQVRRKSSDESSSSSF